MRRSARIVALAAGLIQEEQPADNIDNNSDIKPMLYETECAPAMAQFIQRANQLYHDEPVEGVASLGQQHLLPKGLKIWGEKAKAAARKEMDQLHNRKAFAPVNPDECTESELNKAQSALMFVTEK